MIGVVRQLAATNYSRWCSGSCWKDDSTYGHTVFAYRVSISRTLRSDNRADSGTANFLIPDQRTVYLLLEPQRVEN